MILDNKTLYFRALQKQSDKTAYLNFVPFIEYEKNEACSMLEKELKIIDKEIVTARNALRRGFFLRPIFSNGDGFFVIF